MEGGSHQSESTEVLLSGSQEELSDFWAEGGMRMVPLYQGASRALASVNDLSRVPEPPEAGQPGLGGLTHAPLWSCVLRILSLWPGAALGSLGGK